MLIVLAIGALLGAGTAAAQAAAPINTTAPTIAGSERLGQILTVSNGTWTGTPDIAYTRQWRRCDKAGDNCADIAQAINGSYRLADADVSSTLRVVVTATNGDGATSAATVATDVIGTGETAADAPDTATRYDYDAAGRLKSVIGRDASAAPGDPLQAAIYHWDPVGNLLSVDRRASLTPVIDELEPEQGAVGRKVTITGTGFSKRISQDTVRFNGTEATILDASPTKLVVRVPSGATDGAVSVIAPGGTTTSPEPFMVTSSRAPHIDAISPSVTGIALDADSGETITITGTHFAERLTDNIVLVNGHRAELVSVVPGTLKVKAPPGTAGGRLVVTTPEGTDTGPDLFIQPYGYGTGNVAEAQRIALDQPSTITSNATDKVALAIFDGEVGQEISIDAASVSGYAMVQLFSPNAIKIGEFMVGAGLGNWLDTIHLPEDGTYTLIVQPTYYSPGAQASVTVHDVGNAYAAAQPTAAGTDVDLSSTVAGTNPGVRMNLEAGQEISVAASGSTFGYANFRWIAPDGTELIASNGFAAGSGWWDSVRIPTSGRWTLRVDPQGNYTGQIHLKLYDASELQAAISPDADGDVGHATTTVPGQNARFTFTGHEGQRVSFMGTDDSTVSTSYGSVTATLLSPSGGHLQDTSDLSALGAPTELPADGTYSILVNPRTAHSGVVGLKVWDVPDDLDQDVTPSPTGETKTIELPAAGQVAHLRIHAPAGQTVAIKASESTFGQVGMLWYRPNGSFLGSYKYLGTGGTWFGPTKLDPAGTYDLRVEPGNGSTGSIKLTFYDATTAAPAAVTPTAAGAAFALNIAVPGQTATATFTGHAGQRIGLNAVSSGLSWGFGFGALYAPDGSNVGNVGIGNGYYTDRMTLTQDGTYTITAQGMFEDTGVTQMVIYDVPADLTATVTPTFAGVSTHFDLSPFQNGLLHVAGTAGQKIAAHVDQESPYVNAYWLNASGSRFGPDRWLTAPGGFVDQVTLSATGNVTAVADPPGASGGSTTVKLYDAQDLVDDLGTGGTTHLDFATPGRNALVTFDGEEGDVVAFDFPNATIPHWSVSLYGPSGSQIGFSWGGSTTNTLPADGQYTFVIDPWWEDTGEVDVTVTPSGGSSARATTHTRAVTRVKAGSARGSARTLKQYLRGTSATRLLRAGTPPKRPAALPKEAVAPKTLAEALGKRSMPAPSAATASGRAVPVTKRERSPLSARMRRPSGQSEVWRPKRGDRAPGGWVTGRQPSPWATVPALQGRLGMTSVAGQALKLSGAPLKGVRVSVVGADPVTTTDKTGRFLLEGVPAGKHTLHVEGSAASKGGRRFGDYEILVTLKANVTTTLDDTLWMTRLDATGDRKITSPTGAIRMTNPKIPGFEVRVPAGSRVTDRQGKTLRSLNLSAVPLDRPPFALPAGVTVSAYFTVQPGGAYFSKGAQIVYPNYHHLRPRSRVTFWDYDAKDRGWFEYGKGRVTANGKQIVPDKGVRVWKLSGAMAATNPGVPGTGALTSAPDVGDPVDPYSGLFKYNKTDLSIGGSMPFNLTRTYRQDDPYAYEFGAGFTTVLDTRLVFSGTAPNVKLKLVLTGGTAVDLVRTNSGTDPDTGIYEARGDDAWSGTVAQRVPERGLWLLTKPDGSAMEFYQGGPVTAFVTKTGLRTTVTRGYRNIVNTLQQVNFPDGRWIRFDGNEIWDNAGRHVHYTLDYFQRLTAVEDVDGNTTTYEYAGNSDYLISITDPRGIKFLQNEYAGKFIHKQTLANGGTYTYNYICYEPPPEAGDGSGSGGSGGGGGGGGGGPMTQGPAPGTGGSEQERASTPCQPTQKYLATEITNPNGSVDKITWNQDGGWTKIDNVDADPADPRRRVVQVLDANGRVAEMSSGGGRSVKYTYNGLGDVETETTAIDDDHSATVHYGYSGHDLTSITDAVGKVTQVQRDAKHRVTSVTDPTQRTTHFTYTSNEARPSTVTDAGGHVTRFAYEHGDRVAITDPLGHQSTAFVDAAGRTSHVTDALGRTAKFQYSPSGHLLSATDHKGNTTELEYNENGSIAKITDARGGEIQATYDEMEQLATYIDANDETESVQRDIEGNITSLTDRRGVRTVFRYDALDREIFAGFGAHPGAGDEDEFASTQTYNWDQANRLTDIADSENGTTSISYDGRDLSTQVTNPEGDLTYEFDAAGRRTSMQVGSGTPTTYAYDDAGRLAGLSRGGVSAAFSLDAAGRRTGATLPGGLVLADTLDDGGRLVSRRYTPPGGAPATVNYAYDATDRRVASWGELDVTRLPTTAASSTFDAANRLLSRGTAAFTYDDAGNLTSDGQRTFTWNSRGQLSAVTDGSDETDYGYDPLGRHSSTTAGGGTVTHFAYDRWNVIRQSVESGATTDVLAGLVVDDIFAGTTDSQTQPVIEDAIGTTAGALVSGAVVPAAGRGPSGEGTAPGTYWAGGMQDTTGLVDRRNRFYDPSVRSFIDEDPSGVAGGLNLYAYALSDPINNVDPMGLAAINDFAAGLFDGALVGLPSKAFGARCWGSAHTFGQFVGAVGAGATVGGLTAGAIVAEGAGIGATAVAGGVGGAVAGAHTTLGLNPNASTSAIAAGAVGGVAGGAAGGALAGLGALGGGSAKSLAGGMGATAGVVSDVAAGERWRVTGGRKDEGDC